MMKRFKTSIAAFVLAAFAGALGGEAAIIQSFLKLDGTIDVVRDNSVGVLLQSDGITAANLQAPQPGNILQGIFRVDAINNLDSTNDVAIWAVYSLVVGSVTPGGIVHLAALPAASPFSIASILSDLGLSEPGTIKNGSMDQATIAIIETNASYDLPDYLPTQGFTDSLAQSVNNTWNASVVMGIVNTDNFHEVALVSIGGNPPQSAQFALSNTIIKDDMPFVEYADVSVPQWLRPSDGSTPIGQFVTRSNAIITFGEPDEVLDWHFSDQGTFVLSTTLIPEPSGVVVWGFLALAGLCFARRFGSSVRPVKV